MPWACCSRGTAVTQLDIFAHAHGDRDGATFDRKRDRQRLDSQADRVLAVLRDGQWHSLEELLAKVGGRETALSARIRDLRKPKFGGYTVESESRGRGTWFYRLVL